MDWKNTELPLEKRLDDLLSALTLEEKIQQLDSEAPAIERLGVAKFRYGGEALHGLCNTGRATSFPMPIGMAATFNPELVQRIGSATGDEMRAKFHAREWDSCPRISLLVFSPVINILRDPRWGRSQECFGEDPLLTAEMGCAYIRGLQGDDPRHLKLAACAKHLGVHSGPEKDRMIFNAIASERDMRETYLYAFGEAVQAGVATIMATYNRVNGEHCCAHPFMIGRYLREEHGFDGVILSDGGALATLHIKFDTDGNLLPGHNLTEDTVETAAHCLKGGCDLELGEHAFRHAAEAIERGLLTEADVDRALRRILRMRFQLGDFDPPETVRWSRTPLSVIQCPEHIELARECARQSMVLLRNEAGALPLRAERDRVVLVTGPTATDLQILLGNFYKGGAGRLVSLLEGITAEAPEGVTVSHNQGCFLAHPNHFDSTWHLGLAEWADSVVACIGYSPLMESEQGEAIGAPEGGDKSSIAVPEHQLQFLRRLRESINKNPRRPRLIVVVTAGCPLELEEVHHLADAVLLAWYPGEQGGTAVGQVLWGKAQPGGRLPVTFPLRLDDLPPYEDYSMQGRTYRFPGSAPALYPFGYGRGYLPCRNRLIVASWSEDSLLVEVESEGNPGAEDVIQVYARRHGDPAAAATTLAGFMRIRLPATGQLRSSIVCAVDFLETLGADAAKRPINAKIEVCVHPQAPIDSICCGSEKPVWVIPAPILSNKR